MPCAAITQAAAPITRYVRSDDNYMNQLNNFYVHGSERQTCAATVTAAPNHSFTYDDQGRRLSKTVGAGVAATTTNYLYNGQDILAEYQSWTGALAHLTQGPGTDEPLQRVQGTAGHSYMQDGLGSVVVAVPHDAVNGGATVGTQRFDAWGNSVAQSSAAVPLYGYTGREPDATGLIYYRARYYDPAIQRFTQRDPIGIAGGINAYAYVGNNPISFVDPNGEALLNAAGGIYGAFAGAIAGGIAGYNNAKGGSSVTFSTVTGILGGAVAGGVVGAALQPHLSASIGATAGLAVSSMVASAAGTVVTNAINRVPLSSNISPGAILGAGLGGVGGAMIGKVLGNVAGGGSSVFIGRAGSIPLNIVTPPTSHVTAHTVKSIFEGIGVGVAELAGHALEEELVEEFMPRSATSAPPAAASQQSIGVITITTPSHAYSGAPEFTVNTSKGK